MMNLVIEFDYGDSKKLKELSVTQRDSIRKNVLSLVALEEPPEDPNAYYTGGIYGKFLVTEEEFHLLKGMGLELQVKNFKNTYNTVLPSGDGTRYHFHLPNLGLLQIRKVIWLEDGCTETLQQHLNEGWSILAVCPPNGQRRPDYILGRGDKLDD
jgi:hypothetical protein